jgi:hypothetical protein
MVVRALFAFVVAALIAAPSHAGFGGIGVDLLKKASRNPAKGDTADLNGKAKVKILPGYHFLDKDELNRLTEGVTPINSDDAGVLFPENGDWLIVFRVTTRDLLEGQDKAALNSDALLTTLRNQLAEDNKSRRANSVPELRIVGWTHPPAYDAVTKRLTYGIRVTNDDPEQPQESIWYFTHFYGEENTVVEAVFESGFKGYSQKLVEYRKVMDGVSFGGVGVFGGLSGLADNEKALLVGGVVMVAVVGIGLVMHRGRPEKRRPLPAPRPW